MIAARSSGWRIIAGALSLGPALGLAGAGCAGLLSYDDLSGGIDASADGTPGDASRDGRDGGDAASTSGDGAASDAGDAAGRDAGGKDAAPAYDAATACGALGFGVYCARTIDGYAGPANELVTCDGLTARPKSLVECPGGCAVMPQGRQDNCEKCTSDGTYCEQQELDGTYAQADVLVVCRDGVTVDASTCSGKACVPAPPASHCP